MFRAFLIGYYSLPTPHSNHEQHSLSSSSDRSRQSRSIGERVYRRTAAAAADRLTPIVGGKLAVPRGYQDEMLCLFENKAKSRSGPFWLRAGLPNEWRQRCHRRPAPLQAARPHQRRGAHNTLALL